MIFCEGCTPDMRTLTAPGEGGRQVVVTEQVVRRLAAVGVRCPHPLVEVPNPGDPGEGIPVCGVPSVIAQALSEIAQPDAITDITVGVLDGTITPETLF